MTLYESPQVQEWRIEYAELREEFGTELSEFEFVALKAAEEVLREWNESLLESEDEEQE